MELEQIERLIENLTLEEKIGMIHGESIFHTNGVERLQIPALHMADGPMGVRKELNNDWSGKGISEDYVSYLPSNTAIACTWNRKMARKMGEVLGTEARGRGKDVILAPGINLIRSPLCGRNFEYMSEDPCVISEMAVPLIKGIQSKDTAACVKHFAVNNQETRRLDVDVKVDERALRELYLPGFEAAVKEANVYSVMGAYNRFKGQQCCHNKYLLQDVLRKEWGFDGVVISDWGGVHDTEEAVYNGLDIEMSVTNNFDEYYMAKPLLDKIRDGEIQESYVDEKVKNILILMDRIGMLNADRFAGTYNRYEHQRSILECAQESIVLLKNTDNRLPLDLAGKKKLAVIGENAVKIHSNGGGSAAIKALYELSPLMGLHMELGGNVEIAFAKGYESDAKNTDEKVDWQAESLAERAYKEQIQKDINEKEAARRRALIEEAASLARSNEDVILFCGLNHEFDVEGRDKVDIKLPYAQEALINAVLDVNANTVLVVIAGAPVDMECFAERAKAIVYMSYNGMEGGLALAQVLLGSVNPSGKLTVSIPQKLEDCPAHAVGEFPGDDSVTYAESVYVGYRYYETKNIDVRYCFGHGLSYTAFAYDDLQIKLCEDHCKISFRVKNIGKREGAEVVQLYVKSGGNQVERPTKELRAFEKVNLKTGEEQVVTFSLTGKAFSYYNVEKGRFEIPMDQYQIQIGSSLKDIRLKKDIKGDLNYGI